MRLNTKESREAVKKGHIEYLREKCTDLQTELYKNYDFITYSYNGKFYLEIYKGTSASPFYNYYHTSPESRSNKIIKQKESIDTQETYRNEIKQKNNGKRYLSTAAIVADRIRKILKQKFPYCKFSVKSENYSGGDSVGVSYTDFLPTKTIEAQIIQFKDGHFDGMTDCYNYYEDEHEVDQQGILQTMPRTKFLFVNRSFSESVRNDCKKYIESSYELTESQNTKLIQPCIVYYTIWTLQTASMLFKQEITLTDFLTIKIIFNWGGTIPPLFF